MNKQSNRVRRRGGVMLLAVVAMVALGGFCSLAVDYGHVQVVRAEMQRTADATARSYIDMYMKNGQTYAAAYAPYMASQTYNPVDANAGVNPSVSIVPGRWNAAATSNQFMTTGSAGVFAVQVTVSRTAANANAVPLFWGRLIGRSTCDVHTMCVCALMGSQSGSVTIPSTADPYLAGQGSGATTTWGDTQSNSTPYKVTSISVTPGTYITVSNVNGQSSIVPGTVPNKGGDGNSSMPLHHGQNYDSNPNPGYVNPENGIGDAKMPADALMGVFLSNADPSTKTAPSGMVDWTTSAMQAQTTFTNIVPQQPFMIGNGTNSSGATQQFLVPAGATRLYLGVWDGVCYYNNSGSLSGTINVQASATIVQVQ